jgi:hypothetical protein
VRLKIRLCLVAIVAATLVGGVVPHGALAGAEAATVEVVQTVEPPLFVPIHCSDATCGKGTPAAPAPSPGIVLAGVVGTLAAAAALISLIRRRRLHAATLPAGVPNLLLRPPQFS